MEREGQPYKHQENSKQQPKPKEQAKPSRESVKGGKGQQELYTLDGHEPEAWKGDHVIFRRRVKNGMYALGEKIDLADIAAGLAAEKYQAEAAREDAESGKGDRRGFHRERTIRRTAYAEGLRSAYNLIVKHLHGNPTKGEPKDGLSQGGDPKK